MSEESNALNKQVGGGHYKGLVIQPVEYCHRNNLGFCESSVVKYVSRHKEKNGAQDIRKAIHFLELLLELEYPDTADPVKAPPTPTTVLMPQIGPIILITRHSDGGRTYASTRMPNYQSGKLYSTADIYAFQLEEQSAYADWASGMTRTTVVDTDKHHPNAQV